MDIKDIQLIYNTQRLLLFQLYRFLFLKLLILESIVIKKGYIQMERNYQFINKYNPIILSVIRYNYNINFIPSSLKVFTTIYYIINYIIKAQINCGQLIFTAAILKKAQEAVEAKAVENSKLLVLPLLNISKFTLKAYNQFIRDIEVSAPTIAYFLFRQPSVYILKGNKSIIINFYQVKVYF